MTDDIFYRKSYSGLLLKYAKVESIMEEEAQYSLQVFAAEKDIDIKDYYVEVTYRLRRNLGGDDGP